MSNNISTLMSDVDLNALISDVVKGARSGQAALQTALVQACLKAQHGSGNTNAVTRLVNELPNSSRLNIIKAYIKAHTPIKFKDVIALDGNPVLQDDGRAQVVAKLAKKATAEDWQVDAMIATTYYDWTKQKDAKEADKENEYSVADMLQRFVAKLDKQLAKALDPLVADKVRVQRNLANQALAAVTVTA